MKVRLMWNCPTSCEGYSKPYPCDYLFGHLPDYCPLGKPNYQKYIVVTAEGYPSYYITDEMKLDFDKMEMLSTCKEVADWRVFLKPCIVYTHVAKLPESLCVEEISHKESK
jgi:hypothetical protein